MKRAGIKVSGMHCASCVSVIERGLKKLAGVKTVSANPVSGVVYITYDPEAVGKNEIEKTIISMGYGVSDADGGEVVSDAKKTAALLIFASVFTVPVFVLSMFFHGAFGENTGWVLMALAAPVQFYAGARFYRGAWAALKSFSAGMDTLVALGTSAAYFYSVYLALSGEKHHFYFETSAVLITAVLFGKYLEELAKKSSYSAVKKLLSMGPKYTVVIRDGKEITTESSLIMEGDVIILKAGERAPADGVVEEGFTSMDESILTGEAVPVEKKPGAFISGGSVNSNSLIKYRAVRPGSDTAVTRIAALIEEAQAKKPPVAVFVDRVSSVFTPVIVAVSGVVFMLWFFAADSGLTTALLNSVAVLVAACPCALGLATPAAVMSATALGAKHGIFVRDGAALEALSKARHVVFDKTGTLTEGKPVVTGAESAAGLDEKEMLVIAASLEKNSPHPLATAILAYAASKGAGPQETERLTVKPGVGVAGSVGGREYMIGSHSLVSEMGGTAKNNELIQSGLRYQSEGKSVAYLFCGNECIGVIAAIDLLKSSSAEAVLRLKASGRNVHMLTGDNRDAALRVGAAAGINEGNIISGASPGKKAEIVSSFRAGGGVAYIGDGINDAPALSAASAGIALGAGSDAAVEAGGIVLVRSDPLDAARAIRLSEIAMKKIRQNLLWAFVYNVSIVPVAALGFLNPMLAGAAMALSSVSVAVNSMLLGKEKI